MKLKGFQLYDQGRHADAQPYLEKALAAGVDDPELDVRVAFLRATLGNDPTSAIELLRRSTERRPDYARTYNMLGFIAYSFGPREDGRNLRQAIDLTLKAAQLDSSEWKFMDNLGTYYGQLGVLDTAWLWLKRAQGKKPDYPELNRKLRELESYLEMKALEDTSATAP